MNYTSYTLLILYMSTNIIACSGERKPLPPPKTLQTNTYSGDGEATHYSGETFGEAAGVVEDSESDFGHDVAGEIAEPLDGTIPGQSDADTGDSSNDNSGDNTADLGGGSNPPPSSPSSPSPPSPPSPPPPPPQCSDGQPVNNCQCNLGTYQDENGTTICGRQPDPPADNSSSGNFCCNWGGDCKTQVAPGGLETGKLERNENYRYTQCHVYGTKVHVYIDDKSKKGWVYTNFSKCEDVPSVWAGCPYPN